MNVKEFIINISETYLKSVEGLKVTDFPAGHNGPYFDKETPIRNISHWIITFCNIYNWTGDKKYKEKVKYLSSVYFLKDFKSNTTYKCRLKKGTKDEVNGLIGQAWVIEALYHCYLLLNDEKFKLVGLDIINSHRFIKNKGLWSIKEVNNKDLGVDTAFNHQLWFAASASYFAKYNKDIKENIDIFIKKLPFNLELYENGIIYHLIKSEIGFKKFTNRFLKHRTLKSSLKNFVLNLKNFKLVDTFSINAAFKRHKLQQYNKAVGYHSFNTFALYILNRNGFNFFKEIPVNKIISAFDNDDFVDIINKSKFSFPYNPPGFEIPISYIFSNKKLINEKLVFWLNKQLDLTFNNELNKFSRNTLDFHTLNARIYELSQYPVDILNTTFL